jgi:hypothetical protein
MFYTLGTREDAMIDKVVEIGAGFDIVTPLLTFAQNIAYGPGHTFLISRDCGRSGRDIADLLHRRGVKTWGHMVTHGSLMLRVRQNQARWAQYILQSEGIPFEGGAVAQGSAQSGPSKRSRRSRTSPGTVGQEGSASTARSSARSHSAGSAGGIGETLREMGDTRLF